eukprot:PITA_19913
MGNSDLEKNRNRYRFKWKSWAFVALIGILAIAVAASSSSGRGTVISLFGFSNKLCSCGSQNKLTGLVEDCCCDYETVDTLNNEVLHPSLKEAVKTPFFRVCECPAHEFPESFKRPNIQLSSDDLICQEGKPQATIDRTLDSKAFTGWMEIDNPWTYDDETDNSEMTYVNLQLNPERYTGYIGPSSRRIWDSIYKEHCLKDGPGDSSPERRVFYKLISGLHSSITVHIAAEYLLDAEKDLWGPHPILLYERVLKYPERVRNLYFTFLFVLRAVTKAADYLSQAEYSTGNPLEDKHTQSLIIQLVNNRQLQAACPIPFDEAKLWRGQNVHDLKRQIQLQFKNISALMDCVGCEKCRLWGKLQILGVGTALKILFSVDNGNSVGQPLQLQRNEVIALINLLNRLSESVQTVQEFLPIVKNVVNKGNRSVPIVESVKSSW